MQQYLNSKLEPSIKSDKIPEKGNETVNAIITKQFDEIIIEGKKITDETGVEANYAETLKIAY